MARVAVVTGGTRGIGKAISVALKNAGYKVAATYHGNEAAAKACAQEAGIATYKFDVADFAQCEAGVKKIAAELGPIDVLVNNAGIAGSAPFASMDDELWERTIAVNLTGAYNCMRAIAPGMFERGYGRIINVASTAARVGFT